LCTDRGLALADAALAVSMIAEANIAITRWDIVISFAGVEFAPRLMRRSAKLQRPWPVLVLCRYTCGRQHVDIAAIPAGSRKMVPKKFENVSELGSKRQ
jgi:hypothetical protein